MNTRSQTKKIQEAKTTNNGEKREERENIVLYMVEIDFDEASNCWKKNKKSIGNGSYKYVCKKRGEKNNMCIKKCLQGEEYCCVHFKMFKDGKI